MPAPEVARNICGAAAPERGGKTISARDILDDAQILDEELNRAERLVVLPAARIERRQNPSTRGRSRPLLGATMGRIAPRASPRFLGRLSKTLGAGFPVFTRERTP